MATETAEIEKRALNVAKWANLFMAIAGVTAAIASRSDALLVDGLYSGINFVSAIIAARVAERVNRPPDRSRPWGYSFEETIYVTFRSLTLIGILLFAFSASGGKVITYLTGGSVPELVFGPIAVYSVAMVLICASLAFYHRHAFSRSGKKSSILSTESKAATIDGAISAGSGVALLSLPLLDKTVLAPIVPVGDAIVVLFVVMIIIWQPLSLFRDAITELSGVSAPRRTVNSVAATARALAQERSFLFLRSAVQRVGRTHFVVIFADALQPVRGHQVDEFRAELNDRLEETIGQVRTEVVVTMNAELADR
jgi:predicted Co/Zn/Cd cation transporter (cation efflux family)